MKTFSSKCPSGICPTLILMAIQFHLILKLMFKLCLRAVIKIISRSMLKMWDLLNKMIRILLDSKSISSSSIKLQMWRFKKSRRKNKSNLKIFRKLLKLLKRKDQIKWLKINFKDVEDERCGKRKWNRRWQNLWMKE